jgi:hypothetical protein
MVDADLYEALRHRERHQPLRGLARYAELAGYLVLRVAGDIIKPAGARRLVEPRLAAFLPDIHPLLTLPIEAGAPGLMAFSVAGNVEVRNCVSPEQLFDRRPTALSSNCETASKANRLISFVQAENRQDVDEIR